MTDSQPEIQMIPVSSITVLNPRSRNKRLFQELVQSIAKLGLKKPITVSRSKEDSYNLVCGQGRLEAFQALGQSRIPAVITPGQMARMEREMAALQQHFKAVDATYGDDVLVLVIAVGYLSKLVANRKVERYLSQHHSEILTQFQSIISAASLDRDGAAAA